MHTLYSRMLAELLHGFFLAHFNMFLLSQPHTPRRILLIARAHCPAAQANPTGLLPALSNASVTMSGISRISILFSRRRRKYRIGDQSSKKISGHIVRDLLQDFNTV